ncbi:hypothetical protein JCM11491_001201 [Sporobolomyces phaffii]
MLGAPLDGFESRKPPRRTTVARLRSRLAFVLETPAWHWTIIALSSLEFALSFSEILYDYLAASSPCHCTSTCTEPESLLKVLDASSLALTNVEVNPSVSGVFLVELPLDLFAFGPEYFLPGVPHWFLHSFDAVVVVGAFVLSVGATGPFQSVASLLIALRLWRVLKLVASVEVGSEEFRAADGTRRDEEVTTNGRQGGTRERRADEKGDEKEESGEEHDGWRTRETCLRQEVKRLRKRIRQLETGIAP